MGSGAVEGKTEAVIGQSAQPQVAKHIEITGIDGNEIIDVNSLIWPRIDNGNNISNGHKDCI